MAMDNLRPVQSMTVGELKRELIDLGDSSFVFNDHDELMAALASARRMSGMNGVPSLPAALSSKSSIKKKIHTSPAVIPTIHEESESKQVLTKSGFPSKSRPGQRGKESHGIKSKKNAQRSSIEQNDESVRLVEYFIVVSSKPSSVDPSDIEHDSPPDPSVDELDPRTEMRYGHRCAHLPGGQVQVDHVHISSIGFHSTSSTSSTCSSDDFDKSSRGYDSNNVRPTSTNFSGVSEPKSKSRGDLLTDCVLEPVITARYPAEDRPQHPLNPKLPQFCHPEGSEFIYPTTEYKMPRIHHFVLTDSNAGKLYGTCLTVYEEFDQGATEDSKEIGKKKTTYYTPRVLCLLSVWPYLTAFRTYLTQLYRLATTTDLMEAPIERFVLNICEEVPAPPPGAFEVQLTILNNTIRFWAPPAQQPIAYVGLPFKALFECLDIGNVLFVWYSLACEHKVLLVSDQISLLTVCAEILCSLLFPMKWSHLYIPVLPRSLSAMLDAPMPYLCGISRENFPYAIGDIGDDTVVVDLDRNMITLGSDPVDLPPLPHKHRVKLENALEKNVGHVFWHARGMTKEVATLILHSSDEDHVSEVLSNAHSLWNEKIRSVDEAFNLAHAPDSTSMLHNDDANVDAASIGKQSKWDAVQEAFLRFYITALKEYRKYLPKEEQPTSSSWRGDKSGLRFRADDFVAAQRRDFQPFLEELMSTQQFDDFITKRMYTSDEPDVVFFDKSIDAKKNRGLLSRKKADILYLHSASAHRELQQYVSIPPNRDDVPLSLSSKIGRNGNPIYQYPIWPATFDKTLFCVPRPIPKNIAKEFERRAELKLKLSTIAREIRAERKLMDEPRSVLSIMAREIKAERGF
ncbi:hypothetical protein ACHAWX_005255 [Stephanocyclus meneghinianus]